MWPYVLAGVNFDGKNQPIHSKMHRTIAPLNKLPELLDTEGWGVGSMRPIWRFLRTNMGRHTLHPSLGCPFGTSGRSCAGRGNGRKVERFFSSPRGEWVFGGFDNGLFFKLFFWVISKMYLYTDTYIYIYMYVSYFCILRISLSKYLLGIVRVPLSILE